MDNILTQKELKRQIHYSPWTGKFTWRINKRAVRIGEEAGTKNKLGYIVIIINGKGYEAQRLAHLYMRGYFPEHDMDHIKGINDDNRWKELRHVTRGCNLQNQKIQKNNTSGFPGVGRYKKNKKWYTQIMINKKTIYLGSYDDPLEAALARFTFEVQCPLWNCNHRSELTKAIKNVWPEFSFLMDKN